MNKCIEFSTCEVMKFVFFFIPVGLATTSTTRTTIFFFCATFFLSMSPSGRNMEDTMAARDRLESVRAARRNAPGESSSLTGSLTANYSHHQREWAMQIRALQNRQVGYVYEEVGC